MKSNLCLYLFSEMILKDMVTRVEQDDVEIAEEVVTKNIPRKASSAIPCQE